MQVSFVLAAYNEEDIIADSIERCIVTAEKDFDDYELILVDDASTDSTLSIMKKYAASNPRISVLENLVNLNFGTGMLRGMKYAKKEWIVPLAADLSLPPEHIRKLMEKAEQYDILVLQRVGYKCTPWRKLTSNLNMILLHILYPSLIKGTPVLNYGHIYRKSAFEKVIPLARSPIFVQPEMDLRAKIIGLRVGNTKHRPQIKEIKQGSFGKPHDIIWGMYEILRFRIRSWEYIKSGGKSKL